MIALIVGLTRSSLSEQSCVPFAVRLSLNYGAGESVVVAFNTREQCPGLKVESEAAAFHCEQRQILVDSSKFNVTYSYQGWVHKCQGSLAVHSDTRTSFQYKIGERTFKGWVPSSRAASLKVLVVGDWGSIVKHKGEYDQIFDCLDKSLQEEQYSLILFLGDLSYDLSSDNCTNYETFLRRIEPYTSVYPFMLVPGNHDNINPVDAYIFRSNFFMPGSSAGQYFSFSLGQTLFLGYSPVKQVYLNEHNAAQFDFIKHQLETRRSQFLWAISFSHYPFYCSHVQHQEDTQCKINSQRLASYMKLFRQHQLQLSLGAHEHSFERLYPVKEDGSIQHEYRKAGEVPVFRFEKDFISVLQGDAGNDYFMMTEPYPSLPWTAVVGVNGGFGVMDINSSCIRYRRIKARNKQQQCVVADQFILQPKARGSVVALLLSALLGFLAVVLLVRVSKGLRKRSLEKGKYERQADQI